MKSQNLIPAAVWVTLTALAIQPLSAQGLGGSGGSESPAAKIEKPTPEIDKSRLPPMSVYQAMLDGNKKPGWISFRNISGKQWVYFSALQTLHCRLKEIRYSINSRDLDERFNLVKCNPYTPFALPSNSKAGDTALSLPQGTAETIAVQVVWEDGRESDVVVYRPCPGVGENTCAALVE